MLGRWRKCGGKSRADKQQGVPHALDVKAIRVAVSRATSTRHAEPRELVEEDGVVMSGPAGAPQ